MATPLDSASNLPADSAEEPYFVGVKIPCMFLILTTLGNRLPRVV
jgi:hypothetical protein